MPFHPYPFTAESIFFGDRIQPWVHFVPIALNGLDLSEKYDYCAANLQKCATIAENGRRYMLPYLDNSLYYEVIRRMIDLFVRQQQPQQNVSLI